ncbi:MAG: hypothetical protein VKS61_11660 [Candidatus Sericytochromatia bacterium]|nr:hypothetical protein [Candidatus Sericytochromatia bacterium]
MTTSLEVPGLVWRPEGQALLSGELLRLLRDLDALWLRWGEAVGAQELDPPPMLPARFLQRVDHFASFPHLVTFACVQADDAGTLAAFARQPWRADGQGLALGALAPTTQVLTPSACYHVYHDLVGQDLPAPGYFSLCTRCFRREATYEPLRRQWAFQMRELVCVGTADEVRAHLAAHRARLLALCERLGLDAAFQPATDPFFNPGRSAKHLMQVLDPTKEELVFGGDLAIASLNFHRDAMGTAFDLRRGGEVAQTGCVAFGLERWLDALVRTHGLPGAIAAIRGELAREEAPAGAAGGRP